MKKLVGTLLTQDVESTLTTLQLVLVPCGDFENGVLLMYTLEGVSSVANFITAYEESQ